MSVQKIIPNFSIVTKCPIVINPSDSIFTYQTASTVFTTKNVSGNSSICFPDNYAYLQVYTAKQAKFCCDNNALKNSNTSYSNNMMKYK